MLLAGDGSVMVGDDLSQRWGELREKFDTASSEIRLKFEKDRKELGEKFAGALQKLETDLQEQGKLGELLVVRKEREMFVQSGTLGSDGIPNLSRLRTLYAESLAPIDTGEKEEIARLTQAYLRQLETLQAELTREGDIETAVGVRKEAELARRGLEG